MNLLGVFVQAAALLLAFGSAHTYTVYSVLKVVQITAKKPLRFILAQEGVQQ